MRPVSIEAAKVRAHKNSLINVILQSTGGKEVC